MIEKVLTIDFSGYLLLDPKDVFFVSFDLDHNRINGNEYLSLSEEDRENYIIEDFIACYRDAIDSHFETLKIGEE